MTKNHPITPPPELVAQIRSDALHKSSDVLDYELRMIHAAYRAGADQELEACCEWLINEGHEHEHNELHAARRPKPPSLKEQALEALDQEEEGLNESEWEQRFTIIRRALEALND